MLRHRRVNTLCRGLSTSPARSASGSRSVPGVRCDTEVIDDLLGDYRADVDSARWVEQFEPDEQPALLRAVRRWVEAYYWGPERVEDVLDAVIADLRGERVLVAPLQPAQSTQACLNKRFVDRLRAHGVSIPRDTAKADVHVYLDDVVCTGRTLDRHLRRLLTRVRPGSSVLVFHLVEHAHDARRRRDALAQLAREHDVELRTDHALRMENRPEVLGGLEVIAPSPWSARALDPRYTTRTRVTRRAFRDPDLFGDGPLFDDAEQRDVVERAFLRVGSRIAAREKGLRPLGAGEGPSLGFGAVTFTFHDAPPTMPLALWWHDDRDPSTWFPLVARRTAA